MSTTPFVAVRQIMNTQPIQIDGMSSLQEALQLMRTHKVSALVVRRRDGQDEFGILLLTEIARLIASPTKSLARTQVYEVMIKPAPSVDADMHIKYAIRHMTHFGLSHCIVLDDRELAGVVTLNEMALHYAEEY